MSDLLYIYHRDPSSWEPFGVKQLLTIGGILVGVIIVWFSNTALEISTDNRHYRTYYRILGLRFGRWQLLPLVVGVTLKYYAALEKTTTSSATSWGVWNNTPHRYEKLIVMLSLQHRATGLIIAYFSPDDVNAAIDFAHDTAERFQVPVNQYLPPHMYQPMPPVTGQGLPG